MKQKCNTPRTLALLYISAQKATNWSQPTKYLKTHEIYPRRWRYSWHSFCSFKKRNCFLHMHAEWGMTLEYKISWFFWGGWHQKHGELFCQMGREEELWQCLKAGIRVWMHFFCICQCYSNLNCNAVKALHYLYPSGWGHFFCSASILIFRTWMKVNLSQPNKKKSHVKDNFNRQLHWC